MGFTIHEREKFKKAVGEVYIRMYNSRTFERTFNVNIRSVTSIKT